MASLRMVLKSRVSSIPMAFRRSLSVSRHLRAESDHPEYPVGYPYDSENPAGLLDREQIQAEDALGLAAKERGSWAELSKEDKVALYRNQFATTMEFEKNPPKTGGQMAFYSGVLLAIATVFFVWLKKYVGPELPHTMTPEWREASHEKMKLYRMNPISGISSQK